MVRITRTHLEAVNYAWTPGTNNKIETLESNSSWYVKKSLTSNRLEVQGTVDGVGVYGSQ